MADDNTVLLSIFLKHQKDKNLSRSMLTRGTPRCRGGELVRDDGNWAGCDPSQAA